MQYYQLFKLLILLILYFCILILNKLIVLLKIYRTNQPLILVLLPIITLFIWAPSFSFVSDFKIVNSSPAFRFFETESKTINQLIAIALAIITAVTLNNTINKNEFFRQNIYLPSFISILLISCLPSTNSLHPILFSNLFLVLAFRRLVHINSQVSCKSEVFDASLLLLIGGLFYPPTILYLPIVWVTLLIFKPFQWKEWSSPFLALGLFLIYFFASFLFTETTNYYKFSNITNSSIYHKNSYSLLFYLFGILSFVFVLLGMRQIHLKRKSSTIRYKKMTNMILAFFILGLINFGILYLLTFSIELIFITLIPFTIAISYFFIYFKKTIITEIGLFLLLLLVVLNNYL